MKSKAQCIATAVAVLLTPFRLYSQGYIVPNGVIYGGYIPGAGYQINVIHDPTNMLYTGFGLIPQGKTPPSTPFTNTFAFNPIVDVGVRTFLVSSNDPISLTPILGGAYTELTYPNTYIFTNAVPFYLGFYTGNQNFAPPNGIYTDPLFGWAELVNNKGAIELLDGAIEYKGGGIFAGTQTIIAPEPSSALLFLVGAGLFFARRALIRKRTP